MDLDRPPDSAFMTTTLQYRRGIDFHVANIIMHGIKGNTKTSNTTEIIRMLYDNFKVYREHYTKIKNGTNDNIAGITLEYIMSDSYTQLNRY